METTTPSPTQAYTAENAHPRREPCTRACTQPFVPDAAQPSLWLPVRQRQCPLDFLAMQIADRSVLKVHQGVIADRQFVSCINSAFCLAATTGAVRGASERLGGRGFLQGRRDVGGKMKGNSYTVTADPCPHISPFASAQSVPLCAAPSDETAAVSTPNMAAGEMLSASSVKTPREQRAALTGRNLEYHWPRLTAQGFGLLRIRQTVQRPGQIGTPLDHILQGYTHAKWELEHDAMRDKDASVVQHLVNRLFKILVWQGCYLRLADYASPQGQDERDAKPARERMTAAQDAHREAAFVAWLPSLSDDKRTTIPATHTGTIRMPDRVLLLNYFRTQVRPKPAPHREEA